jgi:glycosyltransferase involved in cell wall biosynthesis
MVFSTTIWRKTMRILFIGHYFQPEPNFFLGLPFAKELQRRGHQVQVVTGFPNYPGGKIYKGYKIKMLQKEIMEGVPVYRFPLYPSHDRSSVKRIICYATLSLSQAAIAPWVIDSADVAYVVQGPATLGVPAIVIKWLRKIPFVYNIQDMWPDSLLSTGMFDSPVGLKLLHAWCSFVYKCAARISVISRGMKQALQKRGVPAEKIEVIYNWCDDALICRSEPDANVARKYGLAGKFNIMFAGNMGKAQALDKVIEAAGLVAPRYPDVQFVFIGSGVEVDNLKMIADKIKISNVLFLPRMPVEEIGHILCLAEVLLVHLHRDPLFTITIPSKTQAYLAMGKPVLMAVEGDAADLVNKAEAGLSCVPESPEALANAIGQFYQMKPEQRKQLGINGMTFYDRELSFSQAVSSYEKVFSSVINDAQSGLARR